MAHDARAVANYIIMYCERENISLSHLALQKILYFSHAWYLVKYNKPLIGQYFEAWKYGPVLRVIYDQLKKRKNITKGFRLKKINITSAQFEEAIELFDNEDEEFLTSVILYYSKFHAGKLVDITHVEDGPWSKIWGKAEETAVAGMAIPNDLIKEWFSDSGGLIRGDGVKRSVN